jgi:hypothetical protein
MHADDLDNKDQRKPDRQPEKLKKLNAAHQSFIQRVKKDDLRQARVVQWNKIEDNVYRYRSYNADDDRAQIKVGEQWFPRLQVIRLCIESAMPKVLNQNYRPSVRVEENKRTFLQPENQQHQQLAQTIAQNGIKADSLPEAAAQMLNPAIEHLRETELLDRDIKKAVRNALLLGEYWMIDGYADGPKSYVCHPRNVYCDPLAGTPEEIKRIAIKKQRSIAYIRENYKEWGHLVRPGTTEGAETGGAITDGAIHSGKDSTYEDEHDITKSVVDVYTVFVYDESVEEKTITEVIDSSQVEKLQQLRGDQHDWSEEALYAKDPEGFDQSIGWKLTRKEVQRTTPSGWKQEIHCGDICLDDGSTSEFPAGITCPAKPLLAFPIENSCHALGLAELVMDAQQMLNQFYKAALEDTQYGTTTFVREHAVEPQGATATPERPDGRNKIHYVRSNFKGTLDDIMYTLPPGESAQSILALAQATRELVEWISGQYDPRMTAQGMRDASGELIKDLKDGAYDRLSDMQEEVKYLVSTLCRNWVLYLVSYDGDERQYKRRLPTGDKLVQFAPALLNGFEWVFDVDVGRGMNMPNDPEEQAKFLIGLIDSLSQKPKQIRDLEIDVLDLPFGNEVKQILDSVEQDRAKQPSPLQLETMQRAMEGLSDALEELVKAAELPPIVRGKALESLAHLAKTGEVPDLSWMPGNAPQQSAPQQPGGNVLPMNQGAIPNG